MISGPYRLVQSLFFGASHGRDLHKIRCTGLEHNLKIMFVKRFCASTTRSRQEDLEYILLFTLVNDYIILIEAVVSVNGSPVYKTSINFVVLQRKQPSDPQFQQQPLDRLLAGQRQQTIKAFAKISIENS